MSQDWTARTVGVVGAGVIGGSVAHALARAGVRVILHDTSADAVERAPAAIAATDRLTTLRRGRQPLAEIVTTTDLDALAPCALVVENVVEDVAVKTSVHVALDDLLAEDAVVAVNTSAVPISGLALATGHPQRVLGAHFMNPVALIDTVELVRTPYLDDAALATMKSLLEHLGKTGIVVQDVAGFVINRCLMGFVNEAMALLDDDVATVQQVDQLFRGCLGHRSGPLQTADLIGLDTVLATLEVLVAEHGPRFEASARLRRMVAAGHLGRKTAYGLYKPPPAEDDAKDPR